MYQPLISTKLCVTAIKFYQIICFVSTILMKETNLLMLYITEKYKFINTILLQTQYIFNLLQSITIVMLHHAQCALCGIYNFQ